MLEIRTSALADRAATGWADAVQRLAAATPQGRRAERGRAGAIVTRAGAATLNAAYDMGTEPDLAALDEMATEVGRLGVPWAIIVRAAAADVVAGLAERHGLAVRTEMPLMVCAAEDAVLGAGESAEGNQAIRAVGSEFSDVYTRTLAAGFEAPEEAFGPAMRGGVLDAAGFTGYLAEVDGQPVATGFGVLGDGLIGVFNIGVVPAARGAGLGRAMTTRALVDGFAAGATVAYLHPSEAGWALYQSMGFRAVETWVHFTG